MITFEFTRANKDMPASEFDQGDITLKTDNIKISSSADPRLKSMIYLSITLLIDGLVKIQKKFEYIAVDSSFCIVFTRKRDIIRIVKFNSQDINVIYLELLIALDEGIELFLSEPKNTLPMTSSVLLDLVSSRRELKKKIESLL